MTYLKTQFIKCECCNNRTLFVASKPEDGGGIEYNDVVDLSTRDLFILKAQLDYELHSISSTQEE